MTDQHTIIGSRRALTILALGTATVFAGTDFVGMLMVRSFISGKTPSEDAINAARKMKEFWIAAVITLKERLVSDQQTSTDTDPEVMAIVQSIIDGVTS